MRLCVFGQCQGGNAKLWFDLFDKNISEFPELSEVTYICNNPNSMGTVNSFKVISLFGRKGKFKLVGKVRVKIITDILFREFFKRHFNANKYDLLHIQGNYNPSLNQILMEYFSGPAIIHIYGSDFYQKYLKRGFSKSDMNAFEQALHQCDYVITNRLTTKKDLLAALPDLDGKITSSRLGAGDEWMALKPQKHANKITHLSTRALYDYNNVDVLVEAFISVYREYPNHHLYIISGYGAHQKIVDRINHLISHSKMMSQIHLQIGSWISSSELLSYYERAHFNYCIGSTDQMTISISYGFLSQALNILSPVPTYSELADIGYKSHIILPEITKDSLAKVMRSNIEYKRHKGLESDMTLAQKESIFSKNFKKYIDLYKSIVK